VFKSQGATEAFDMSEGAEGYLMMIASKPVFHDIASDVLEPFKKTAVTPFKLIAPEFDGTVEKA
jgi:hypothetical protein